MDPLLVTTAIPYVNARPHLGFALEAVLADILARHARLRGRTVKLASGTDENSLKNVLAAERAGVPLERFVREHADAFAALSPLLDLSYDVFVRTRTDADHRAVVEALWRAARHDLHREHYRGRYCVGCEAFLETERCAEHDAALEIVDEENWFFRASKYAQRIREAIESGALEIVPEVYARESLQWLAEVPDVSVSRSSIRARGAGIPVPDDPTQVIYVWFDALAAYLTASRGVNCERVHVVGKGIVRFHTVLWPAILLSAGLPLPRRILVHGYLTVDGEKVSKSGVGVDPFECVAQHGTDAVRHFLARHVRTSRDCDVRQERIRAAYKADLADGLGNLVQRTVALIERHEQGCVPPLVASNDLDAQLVAAAERLPSRVDEALVRFAVDEASGAIFELVADSNRYVDRTAPWALAKSGDARLHTVLAVLVRVIGTIAAELAPFLPRVSTEIGERLREPIRSRAPLFPQRHT